MTIGETSKTNARSNDHRQNEYSDVLQSEKHGLSNDLGTIFYPH
jgi:hypothetical protein